MILPKNQPRVIVTLDSTTAANGDFLPFEITLSAEESHHVKNVLRKKSGAELVAIDRNSGRAFTGVISAVSPSVILKLLRPLASQPARGRVGLLACALIKGDNNELVCEKACELGVGGLLFWESANSVVRLSSSNLESKRKRFNKIIESAAAQSGNSQPPVLEILSDTEALIKRVAREDNATTFFCSLDPAAKLFKDAGVGGEKVNLIVGPEGDFTAGEEEAFRAAGWLPLSLGPVILRAETAAIASVATVNAICGFDGGG